LAGLLLQYVSMHFSEPALVESFAKFWRRKSVQQRIDRTIHRQNKNYYPSVQIGYKFYIQVYLNLINCTKYF